MAQKIKIKKPKREGKKVYVLVFDLKLGRHKLNSKGNYSLNPIEKIKCMSIVDARAILLKYLIPSKIPSYERCREIINEQGYISLVQSIELDNNTRLIRKYRLG